MIHALKAERVGFVQVANPPPWIGTADGGLVTTFEVYRGGKTVLVKLEFSPHRSEEAQYAKDISNSAVKGKIKNANFTGGFELCLPKHNDDFSVVRTSAC